MNLREKLEKLRTWDAEEAMCDGTYSQVLNGLIDVALAAAEYDEWSHDSCAVTSERLKRLDEALKHLLEQEGQRRRALGAL